MMHNIQDDIPTAPLGTSPEDSAKVAALCNNERTTGKHTPIVPPGKPIFPRPLRFKLKIPPVSPLNRLRIYLGVAQKPEAPPEPTPVEQVIEAFKQADLLQTNEQIAAMTPPALPVVDIADLPTTILTVKKPPVRPVRSVRPVPLETPVINTGAYEMLTAPDRFVRYEYVEFVPGMRVTMLITRALDAFREHYRGFEPVQLDMNHMNRVVLDIFMSGQMAQVLAGIALRDTSTMDNDYLQGRTTTIVVIGRWNTRPTRVTQKLAPHEIRP